MKFHAQAILLDIEGTTSSISYVHDEMFPFARHQLADYLQQNWGSDRLADTLNLLAADLETNRQDWLGDLSDAEAQQEVQQQVHRMMDQDIKATGLKQLQGDLWQKGFQQGQLVAHLWPDVPQALQQWHQQGLDLRIYSSGSVAAQKLFFGHSIAGNLLPLFSGHYDTRIGGKKEVASYQAIVRDWGLPAEQLLFLSDVPEELQAAGQAGLQVGLSVRPGNAEVGSHDFPVVTNFLQLEISNK